MAKVAGVDVLLYVQTGGTPETPTYTVLGGQNGATLNRSAKVIDTTSKETGAWAENIAGVLSWSIDCDGFMVTGDTALDAMDTAFNGRDVLKAEIRVPSGKKYTGNVYITDFSYEFPADDGGTYKLTLTGSGALTVATNA
ncbi:phage tail tube protein [Heliophilum fasciatum]|uniref:TP901-1 family phage major tail protein n=1 Tax=Heliophilum fasciatum TaxID=35700 RepID=A0A4R2RHQ0_9FIRM|nr:phage major tail protein, TP901-1 family [Heliophilum fasciatum]MCW2278738.1 TP901-1 family phage major tail protein [Heliophilum fasciatum]TCP62523.1 TP901-1 family phage major tail protein [Heliophilum fasciatum]